MKKENRRDAENAEFFLFLSSRTNVRDLHNLNLGRFLAQPAPAKAGARNDNLKTLRSLRLCGEKIKNPANELGGA